MSHTLGWTLVHSLWEIAAIAVLFFVATLALSRANANLRYMAGLLALGACLVAPVITFCVLAPSQASHTKAVLPPVVRKVVSPSPAMSQPRFNAAAIEIKLSQRIEPYLPALVLAWLVGLGLMCGRLTGGLLLVERIRRKASPASDHRWLELMESLSGRLRLRRPANLLVSDRVETPAVVGILKAIVLFPAGALARLSPTEVEALLAHELAHVRRHDYLVNIVQSLVETVLFFHPAVWWISSAVRTEREHCCDDLAVSVLGDREQFAGALMGLEQLRQSAPRLAMAATNGHLVARIRRILLLPPKRVAPSALWLPLLLAFTLAIGFAQTGKASDKTGKSYSGIGIWGRVIDENGRPVSGATVLCQEFNFETMKATVHQSLSDPSGAYRFHDLPGGGFNVVAMKSGMAFGTQEFETIDGSSKPVVRLRQARPVTLQVVDANGAPMSGIRVGPAFIGESKAYIRMLPGMLAFLGRVTDANGWASFNDLPTFGYVRFDVDDDRYVAKAQRGFLDLSHLSNPRLTVVPSTVLDGVVTMEGKPVPGARISGVYTEYASNTAISDGQGRFKLTRQPEGPLTVYCTMPYRDENEWVTQPMHVTAHAGKETNIHILLEHGAIVAGKVISANGKPMADVSLSFRRLEEPARGVETAWGTTGPDGAFRTKLASGSYELGCSLKGRSTKTQITVCDGETRAVRLTGPSTDGVKAIRCKVFDENGKPAANAYVQVSMDGSLSDAPQNSRRTGPNGEFTVYLPSAKVRTVWFTTRVGGKYVMKVRPADGVAILKAPSPAHASAPEVK